MGLSMALAALGLILLTMLWLIGKYGGVGGSSDDSALDRGSGVVDSAEAAGAVAGVGVDVEGVASGDSDVADDDAG